MMFEVSTKDELKKALLHKEDAIHITNNTLSENMFAKPDKFRFIRYAMFINGYKIIKIKTFGAFDVKFVKQ